MEQQNESVKCPKCNSTQVVAFKKGFSGKKAVAGALLTGGIGLLAGTIGSNKIKLTCLSCGHEFSPNVQKTNAEGNPATTDSSNDSGALGTTGCLILLVFFIIAIVIMTSRG